MKTLLGILTVISMIFSLGAFASAAELMTPLVYAGDYECGVVNLDNTDKEVEITYCDDGGKMYGLVTCDFSYVVTLAPGQKENLSTTLMKCNDCLALCKFSVKGNVDKVRAGLRRQIGVNKYELVPATK